MYKSSYFKIFIYIFSHLLCHLSNDYINYRMIRDSSDDATKDRCNIKIPNWC